MEACFGNSRTRCFGLRTIAPKENCLPGSVRVWVRVRFKIRGWKAIFIGGNCPRTRFFKVICSIVNSMERVNTKKGTQST